MDRILIVDGEKPNIAYIRAQLEEYEIIEAGDGRTALGKIRADRPDLILLDVLMPGLDGYSVLSIIRNAEETRRIPVILISSLSGVNEKIKSLEKGADDFITKPFNPHELKARVRNLLRIKDLQKELKDACSMIIALISARESRDEFCNGHSERTSFYAEKLAQKFFLIRDQIKTAGQLHDIGKTGISDSIFLKPGELDSQEFEMIKIHPAAGEKICSSITSLKAVLPIIKHHHERYDGSGYPDGLKGNDIPLGARIVAVADAFDALTSPRPYRRAYSQGDALQIMLDGAGTQWDPKVVSIFCDMVKNDSSIANQQSLWYLERQGILE